MIVEAFGAANCDDGCCRHIRSRHRTYLSHLEAYNCELQMAPFLLTKIISDLAETPKHPSAVQGSAVRRGDEQQKTKFGPTYSVRLQSM